MSLLGNIVWFVFGGFFSFLGYLLSGLCLCLTIVGIPFGIQSIKIGVAILAPLPPTLVCHLRHHRHRHSVRGATSQACAPGALPVRSRPITRAHLRVMGAAPL